MVYPGNPDNPAWTNGFVNPNSTYSNALAAVFNGVRLERYIGDTNGPIFTYEAALSNLVPEMVQASTNGCTNCFSRASWAGLSALQTNGPLALTNGLNNMQRESLIRNSYRLFSPNQNLFTVIVAAETIKDNPKGAKRGSFGPEDVITGHWRALAVVWRDPFPDANGVYETDIRFFKYLEE